MELTNKEIIENLRRYDVVNACTSAEDLANIVRSFADEDGNIQGRTRDFNAEAMASQVEGVVNGSQIPTMLTRNWGIRQQALYIGRKS